jgi:hypothetical protein
MRHYCIREKTGAVHFYHYKKTYFKRAQGNLICGYRLKTSRHIRFFLTLFRAHCHWKSNIFGRFSNIDPICANLHRHRSRGKRETAGRHAPHCLFFQYCDGKTPCTQKGVLLFVLGKNAMQLMSGRQFSTKRKIHDEHGFIPCRGLIVLKMHSAKQSRGGSRCDNCFGNA